MISVISSEKGISKIQVSKLNELNDVPTSYAVGSEMICLEDKSFYILDYDENNVKSWIEI